jgi:molybdopterin-containing oxidoreductase family iron-sulfur binding subunit
MVIDLDRCTGCGACMVACAVENNVPPAHRETTERNGITPMRVFQISNGLPGHDQRKAFIPVLCQQCGEHTPCVSACPQQAVEVDAATGIVHQMPQRCLGCRYCVAACPSHARYFNWWDPAWPGGLEKTLNPAVSPRMRGVVEKCNFCHGRLHAARARAAAAGRREIDPADYQPACAEACPAGAIVFGDLNDESSDAARLAHSQDAFRLLPRLGTEPKIYYRSSRGWVQRAGEARHQEARHQEATRG